MYRHSKNNLAVCICMLMHCSQFRYGDTYSLQSTYVKCTVDDFPESRHLPQYASATPNSVHNSSGEPRSHVATIYYVPLLRRRPFRTIPFQFPVPRDEFAIAKKKRKRGNIWRCLSYTYRNCADDSFDLSSFLFLSIPHPSTP